MRIDACTSNGAAMLAQEIAEYWVQQGYEEPAIYFAGGSHDGSVPGWYIRSDMVNGMPRRRVK